MSPELKEKLSNIRLLLLDIDGVMTDGSILYTGDGDEIKCFNARDGFGIRLLMDAGVRIGVVTGRSSRALHRRCEDLKIDKVWDGVTDKLTVLPQIMADTGFPAESIAFVGDDLIDLPLMRRVGLAVAVADARPELLKHAHIVTNAPGGRGAVREVCEAILRAQNRWAAVLERYNAGDGERTE